MRHDQTTRELDFKWEGTPNTPEGSGEVKRVDGLVDRTLTALRDGAESQAAAVTPGDGIAEKVAALLKEIFPAGVQAVTTMTYVDELLTQNEAIRLYLRSRRAVEDVNPETGEVDPAAPVSNPASEGGGGAPV